MKYPIYTNPSHDSLMHIFNFDFSFTQETVLMTLHKAFQTFMLLSHNIASQLSHILPETKISQLFWRNLGLSKNCFDFFSNALILQKFTYVLNVQRLWALLSSSKALLTDASSQAYAYFFGG